MKRRSHFLLAGLTAAAAALSCDEGRLLTEVERQPVKVEVSAPSGPEALLVGETGTYTTTVRTGDTVLEPEVLTFAWSARPPGLLAVDTSDHGSSVTATALSPGVAILTARAAHPDIQQDSNLVQIRVLLQGVAAVAPRSGDTTLAAVGDAFTVRARGYGKDDISADSAGLSWTHRGSALSVAPPLSGLDSLRVTAEKPGTDTLIFSAAEEVCAQSSCTDTILVRVVPVPVRIEVSDTVRLFTLGRSVTPTVRVFDGNENVIAEAAVEWSLARAADSATAGVSDGGVITALGNGIAAVVARAGSVEDTVVAAVHQKIAQVVAPDSVSLGALQALEMVALAAVDSGGAALERPYHVDWRSRDESVVTVSGQSDGQARITAVGTGAAYVIGETETHADSVWVRVTQVPATVRVEPGTDTLNALAQTAQLTAEIRDGNGNPAPTAELSWSSADPGVATVSSDGLVTAVSVGSTTVAAESEGVRDSAALVVRQVPATVTAAVPATLTAFGATASLTASVEDANGHSIPSPELTWTIVDGAGAGVITLAGDLITAVENGTTDLLVSSGEAIDTVSATVVQAIGAVALDTAALSFDALQVPDTVRLGVLDPGGSTVTRPFSIDWSSSAASVATVAGLTDGRAAITSQGDGSATVTATVEGVSDSLAVTVAQVVGSVTVDPPADTLDALAATAQLAVEVTDPNGVVVESPTVEWSSLAPSVATVSASGLVTAVAGGVVDIVAASGAAADTATFLVRQVPSTLVASDADTLESFGATATLSAVVRDANGHLIASPGVSWSIASETVAGAITLSGDLITAVKNGTVLVEASVSDLRDTASVVVEQAIGVVALDTAALSFDALQVPDTVAVGVLDPGGSAVTRPFSIDWSSSAESVATVAGLTDGRAAITSQGDGSATVTATVEGVSDSLTVTVVQVVDSLAIVPSADTLNALGDTLTLSATALDRNGQAVAGADIGWSTTAPTVVDTVDATTGRVYSVATGVAMITATAAGVTDSATITSRQVAATVTVTPAVAADTLLAGDTLRFAATVSDSNGVSIPGTATWTTGSGAVATVSASGLVTAQTVTALDSTPIIATFSPAADSVRVFVEPATLTAVVVAPDSVRFTALGATVQLSAEGVNQNGNAIPGETVTWTSLAPGIATVDGAGIVTAVGNGTTHVVATSDSDATVRDTAKVVVEQVVASVAVTPDSHTFDALTATHQFSAVARDSGGVAIAGKSFTWLDDAASPGVISVDGTGLVTANQVGASQVIALTDGVADSAEVTIRQVPASISTAPAVDTVAVGGTVALTAVVRDSANVPIPDTAVAVTWASLDPATTVDTAGVVSGVAITDSVRIRAHPTGHDHIRATSRITVVSSYVLDFDGDDYGNAGDVLALGTAWTIEAWVKPVNSSGTQYLLARGGSSASNGGSYGLYLTAGKPAVFIRSGPNAPNKQSDLVSTTTLSTTAWSHVAVSYDAARLRMYINGVATDSMPTTNTPQTAAHNLIFGASDTAAANPLLGKLDEVRFWSTVRTPAEIAGAYQATLSGGEAGLLAWWPFSAGSGDPVDGEGGLVLTFAAPPNDPAWTAEYPKIP